MSAAPTLRPESTEYNEYFDRYISLVPQGDVILNLERQLNETLATLLSISEADANSSYAPGKWSLKEVVGHILDSERVFGYRALAFARNDAANLPGFEQDDYVSNGSFNSVAIKDLALEFEHVRRANILFFRHLAPEAWQRTGVANNNPVSVRAIAYIIAGHELHHLSIIKTRYLKKD
jgi:hypothetical protein